jgi:hypothetical protein
VMRRLFGSYFCHRCAVDQVQHLSMSLRTDEERVYAIHCGARAVMRFKLSYSATEF